MRGRALGMVEDLVLGEGRGADCLLGISHHVLWDPGHCSA